MEKQIYFSKISKISRVITLLLCFILLFVTVAKPITAKAVVAESIAIGVGGIAGVSVSWPIVVVVLAVIAVGGLVGGSLSKTVDTAKNWYNSSEAVRKWADTAGADVANGSTTVYIPPDVSRYFNNQNDEDQPVNMSSLYIPTSFLLLDSLTRTDLLGVDIGGLLTEGNDLTVETNSILNNIRTFFGSFDLNIKSIISSTTASLKSSIRVLSNNMMNRLETVNTTIKSMTESLAYRVENITESVVSVRTAIGSLKESLAYRIESVTSSVNTVKLSINNLKESLAYRIENISEVIVNTRANINNVKTAIVNLPSEIATAISSFFTSLELKIESLTGVISPNPSFDPGQDTETGKEGINRIPALIGRSKDLLSKYSVAFLAVGATVTKFIDLPVVGDLVEFGFALGIFALVVNLGNTLVSKHNDNSVKGKKNTAVKGG